METLKKSVIYVILYQNCMLSVYLIDAKIVWNWRLKFIPSCVLCWEHRSTFCQPDETFLPLKGKVYESTLLIIKSPH